MSQASVRNYLKKIRESKNLTQNQLSELSGVARYIISDFENEKRRPSARTISRLSEALGCSYITLMTGKDEVTTSYKKVTSVQKEKYLQQAAKLVKEHCQKQQLDIELMMKVSGHLSQMIEEYDLSSALEKEVFIKSLLESKAKLIASEIFVKNKMD